MLDAGNAAFVRNACNSGWGFVIAWGISIIFTDAFSVSGSSNLGMFWTCSMVGAPISLLAFYFVKDDLKQLRYRLDVAALILMVLGTACLAMSLFDAFDDVSTLLQISGGLVSSIGTAFFTVLWGSRYSCLNNPFI